MRKQLLFTAVVSLFVACSQDAIEEKHETQTSMVNIPEKIYAEIDNVTSRTYVEEVNHLRWNEGDEISYFPGITYNLEYRFDGKTGDNSGSFTKITDKLVTGNELENTYAYYRLWHRRNSWHNSRRGYRVLVRSTFAELRKRYFD